MRKTKEVLRLRFEVGLGLRQIDQRHYQHRREQNQQPQRAGMTPSDGQRAKRAKQPDQQQQVAGQGMVAGQRRAQIGLAAQDKRFRINPTTSRPRPFSTALAE